MSIRKSKAAKADSNPPDVSTVIAPTDPGPKNIEDKARKEKHSK